ncbi:MAG: glycosyltransferase family 4 protein [Bryobacteraceae bacterium]|nr:glycosyltransferase family 4 protein [Bryobacteraceae bacterium]
MAPASQGAVLALFPSLESAIGGGIQTAGRYARRGLQSVGRLQSFYYGHMSQEALEPGDRAAPGKFGALWCAATNRWEASLVLVWHLNLLRLVPFFRVAGAQLAVFLHGIECWCELDWLTEQALRRVDLFLSNSEYTWKRFSEQRPWLAGKRFRIVPLGLGEPAGPGDVCEPDQEPAALMLGRLVSTEDYKGHREVIEAWPRVLRQTPGAKLWIAGDGDLRPTLERQAEGLGLRDHVEFLGYISEEEKVQRIRRSRCLALPSRGEGFGLVYLEAMRLGRPCLAGSLDAAPEVVRPPRAGLTVDPADPDALAGALRRLLTAGEEWNVWSHEARRLYEGEFTREHFERRLREALGDGGSARASARR